MRGFMIHNSYNKWECRLIVIIHHIYVYLFSGGDICHKCWEFMTIAIKVIDVSLRGKLLLFRIFIYIYIKARNGLILRSTYI